MKKPKRDYPKQYFNSVEEIYAKRLGAFLKTARKYIYNRDLALDVVHDALAKSIVYFNANKERKVREEVIHWLIIKACKKHNKTSREIPYGDTRQFDRSQLDD